MVRRQRCSSVSGVRRARKCLPWSSRCRSCTPPWRSSRNGGRSSSPRTLLPSFALARDELAQDGLKLDIKTVHSTTHRLGQQLLQTRRHDLERYRAGLMPAGTQLAGKRVVAQIDGGRIRLRKVTRKQKGK